MNREKNGKKTLKLFQDYDGTKDEAARGKLLERVVARVTSILIKHEEPNGNLQQLLEAQRRYPTAFRQVIEVTSRRLELPGGLKALLWLYIRTQDGDLEGPLLEIRGQALAKNQWEVFEILDQEGLAKQLARRAEELRQQKERMLK